MDYTFITTHSFTMCIADFADLYERFCNIVEDYISDVNFEEASDETKEKILESIIMNAIRVHKGENVE